MCTPETGILGIISTMVTAGTQAANIYEESKNEKYKIQAAINNAQAQKNEGLRQKQLGIENARLEKAQGIQEANKLRAKAGASGFYIDSQTSQLNYQDSLKSAYDKADSIEQTYQTKADSYFDSANSYLDDARKKQENYSKNLYSKAMNGLQATYSVASSWYEKGMKKRNKGEL